MEEKKRPHWKHMRPAELARECARLRAKERTLRERLKEAQAAASNKAEEEQARAVQALRAQLDSMAATAHALLHRSQVRR